MKIRLKVNGKEHTFHSMDESITLVNYLRKVLGFTGTKNGCGEGHCGACTVVVDGRAVLSCLLRMKDLNGASVYSIEGLSDETTVHPLIYSFAREGAVQCGFCTPGFIMAAYGLLQTNPQPDEKAIGKALVKNICRCTGYVKIVKAVQAAAELLREGTEKILRSEILPDREVPIGEPVIRIDSIGKADGSTRFADDMAFENMLYAKVLRSEKPHADILDIDIAEAEKTDKVVKILLAKDVPGKNSFGPIKKDQEVLATKRVRYTGDALAAVYAESEEAAEEAVAKIRVAYEELPVLSGYQEALKEEPVLLHEASGNIIARMESGRGDVKKALAEADHVFEEEFDTQYIEHAYLEPESCIAKLDQDDTLVVYVASQGPPMDINEIAPVVNMPAEKIRIAGVPMGGGFGGKEDISVQIIASLGSLATGRPVKYTFTRRESIKTSGKRHATRMSYTSGVSKDGTLMGLKADITALGGAYASVEEAVILRSVSFAAGPYTIRAAEVKARAVYRNHAPACAMRGFGNPVVTFASETMMNKIADKLEIDPIELRLKNVLEEGKPTLTGDRIEHSVGARACLEAVRDALGAYTLPEAREGWALGVGVACSYKNVGLGIGMDDAGGARLEILDEGTLVVRVGSVDMGQGANSAMAQIASSVLGWPFRRLQVHAADTALDPPAGMTTASRQTFITGNAVLQASLELKKKLAAFLAAEIDSFTGDFELRDRVFYRAETKEKLIEFDEFLIKLRNRKSPITAESWYRAPETHFSLKEPAEGYKSNVEGHLHAAYCFAAQATVLEVQKKTGRIKVHDVFVASDAGKIINRAAVEGQMEGAVLMGLGYALSEEYKEEGGTVISDTYGKLGVPRITAAPRIHCMIIENTHPEGPFGAKGMGELPISLSAPSIVHAVHNAVGVWVQSLPVLPEKIVQTK